MEEVVTFSPNLLVVSGLQMMDNYPFGPGIGNKTDGYFKF